MKPQVELVPSRDVEGTLVFIKGSGWASCQLRITLNGREAKIARIVAGFAVGKQVKPDGSGAFAIQIIKLIAGFHSEGVFMSTFSSGSWSQWTQITSAAFPAEYNRIAFGQSKNHPNTIYAAFADVEGSTLSAVVKNSTGGSSWTPLALPVEPTWGADYNLIIAAHPDNTDTAYLGLNSLWKTQTGGTSWTKIDCNVICSHWDHHAFAFHPSSPEIIYDCNDGGVFLSEEGGDKWQQCNRDLATT